MFLKERGKITDRQLKSYVENKLIMPWLKRKKANTQIKRTENTT